MQWISKPKWIQTRTQTATNKTLKRYLSQTIALTVKAKLSDAKCRDWRVFCFNVWLSSILKEWNCVKSSYRRHQCWKRCIAYTRNGRMFIQWNGRLFIEGYLVAESGPALSPCNRGRWIGPRALGGPRHGVWEDCSFLSDTPCAWEFSRNAIQIVIFNKKPSRQN